MEGTTNNRWWSSTWQHTRQGSLKHDFLFFILFFFILTSQCLWVITKKSASTAVVLCPTWCHIFQIQVVVSRWDSQKPRAAVRSGPPWTAADLQVDLLFKEIEMLLFGYLFLSNCIQLKSKHMKTRWTEFIWKLVSSVPFHASRLIIIWLIIIKYFTLCLYLEPSFIFFFLICWNFHFFPLFLWSIVSTVNKVTLSHVILMWFRIMGKCSCHCFRF